MMSHSERLYADPDVKGPHRYKGKSVYYVTTKSGPTDIYLRKDGSVGKGTIVTGESEKTRGFWDSFSDAHIALNTWKIKYYNEIHGTEESEIIKEPKQEPEPIKDIKRYTKKEFLKIIQEYI